MSRFAIPKLDVVSYVRLAEEGHSVNFPSVVNLSSWDDASVWYLINTYPSLDSNNPLWENIFAKGLQPLFDLNLMSLDSVNHGILMLLHLENMFIYKRFLSSFYTQQYPDRKLYTNEFFQGSKPIAYSNSLASTLKDLLTKRFRFTTIWPHDCELKDIHNSAEDNRYLNFYFRMFQCFVWPKSFFIEQGTSAESEFSCLVANADNRDFILTCELPILDHLASCHAFNDDYSPVPYKQGNDLMSLSTEILISKLKIAS
jgi:hypothetical protein